MKFSISILILLSIGYRACQAQENIKYESENLKIEQLTQNTFVHISYLQTETFGKVACNGMIVMDNGEALVIDTPINDSDSKELLDWIERSLKCKPKGVLVTHFHIDCLGGINEFHSRNIPSYASNKTIELAKNGNETLPQNGFDQYLELKVGNQILKNEFMGEGHTRDNIISYYPSEKILFGGCLIKSVGAGKGNLEDANVIDWTKTIENIKVKYKKAKIIVPGHGKPGNEELLDFTIELFSN